MCFAARRYVCQWHGLCQGQCGIQAVVGTEQLTCLGALWVGPSLLVHYGSCEVKRHCRVFHPQMLHDFRFADLTSHMAVSPEDGYGRS
jgi:hypothetical protein